MRIYLHALLALTILLASVAAHAQPFGERITGFDAAVAVRADATIDVVETIGVIARGDQIKHGIYRDFPTEYTDRAGHKTAVGFRVVDVSRDGAPIEYTTRAMKNGRRVYLGLESVWLPAGPHTYVLHYQTDHQLGYFEQYDELYWNVTGNGWTFPIDRVTATLAMPPGATLLRQSAYTGRQGEAGRDYTVVQNPDGTVGFATTRTLGVREGLTVAVAWPKGLVAKLEPMRIFSRNDRAVMCCVLLTGVAVYYLIVGFVLRHRVRRGVIIPLFEAPDGLSPGEVNYLYKKGGGDDIHAFSASLVSMAVKGHIKIHEIGPEQGKGAIGAITHFLAGLTHRYMLRNAEGPAKEPLSSEEKIIAAGIHGELALDRTNSAKLQIMFREYEADLRVYGRRYYVYHWRYLVIGIVLGALAMLPLFNPDMLWVMIMPAIVLSAIFGRLLKVPTVEGRKLIDRIEGLRMYLGTAEKDRLDFATPPAMTPEIFEKFLPYAMALGVQNKWGEQFADVVAGGLYRDYAPGWYAGNSWDHGNIAGFTSSFATSFSGTVESSASPPGSSSGSGGGGSSGGGGGGGGGGGF